MNKIIINHLTSLQGSMEDFQSEGEESLESVYSEKIGLAITSAYKLNLFFLIAYTILSLAKSRILYRL